MSPIDQTATQLLARLAAGETTSAEVTEACLDRIDRHDERLGAFLRVDSPGCRWL